MLRCCVTGCSNKGGHNFPSEESVRQKWCEAVGLEKSGISLSDTVVCDLHFGDFDYFIIKGSGSFNTMCEGYTMAYTP